jgi:DNA-binding HxlR family transcriptional regulator
VAYLDKGEDGSFDRLRHMKVTETLPLKPGDPECPVREILAHVGNKWPVLVITNLAGGTVRFSEIRRRIGGISQRMLTETVRSLERDGIVLRTVYPTIPPKVEYSLTPLGRSLLPLIMSLVHWSLDHRSEIRTSRSSFDIETTKPVNAAREAISSLPTRIARRSSP